MINGRTVVGRLRQTGGEQSDSNKVNLPPIHLPQPISCLTARALHTLTNATPLGTRAQAAVVPHAAFFSAGREGGCSARTRLRIKRRGKTHLFLMAPRHCAPPSHPPDPLPSSIIHQRRRLSEGSTLPHRFLWLPKSNCVSDSSGVKQLPSSL